MKYKLAPTSIYKRSYKSFVKKHPELVDKLAESVAIRQARLAEEHSKDKIDSAPILSKKNTLSQRIRVFFQIERTE